MVVQRAQAGDGLLRADKVSLTWRCGRSLAAVLAVATLAGCVGGDGQDASPGSPLPQSTSTTSPTPGPATAATGMRFGLDADSLDAQSASGVTPDYASIWIGDWNLKKGWLGPDAQFAELRAAGITPAVQLYYWGDDLSPACLREGCKGKDQAGWDRLAAELTDHLWTTLDGEPVLVILETEFNKASVARHEPLDGLLEQKARGIQEAYPAAQIVLGLGAWNAAAWGTWDRAAAASSAIGLQALAGSAHGLAGQDPGLFNETLAGVVELQRLFGKPVILQDVAVPSAPHPATVATQLEALAPFVQRLAELRAAGVEAILYRSFLDSPAMSLDNFYGEAERHFGLATAPAGVLKPAGKEWVDAMLAEARAAADARGNCTATPNRPAGPGHGREAPESCS